MTTIMPSQGTHCDILTNQMISDHDDSPDHVLMYGLQDNAYQKIIRFPACRKTKIGR